MPLIASLSVAISAAALAVGEQPPDYGPAPSRSQAVAVGNSAIRKQILDPGSARIDWPRPFVRGTLKLPGLKPERGWYTCGFVNGLDKISGKAARNSFLIMFYRSKVVLLEVGTSDGSGINRASYVCTGNAPKDWVAP